MRFNRTLRGLLIRDARYFFESFGYGVEWINFDKSTAFARLYSIPRVDFGFSQSHILDFDLRSRSSLEHAVKEAREAMA
jgi:hypothetical protein